MKKLVVALLVAAALFAALAVPAFARNTGAVLTNRGLGSQSRFTEVNCNATAADVNRDGVRVLCVD